MEAGSAILTIRALDGLAARAAVTSANIANANTRSYRPLEVRFEDALRLAASAGDEAVATVQPHIEPMPLDKLGDDGKLRLDLEMSNASTTSLRYGALIAVLGREMQLDSLAMTGNNG